MSDGNKKEGGNKGGTLKDNLLSGGPIVVNRLDPASPTPDWKSTEETTFTG
jgi:hypothetical protein